MYYTEQDNSMHDLTQDMQVPPPPPITTPNSGNPSEGRRSNRTRRLPRRYEDYLPTSDTPTSVLPNTGPPARITPEPEPEPLDNSARRRYIVLTKPDKFNLVRAYSRLIPRESQENTTLEDLCDNPILIDPKTARRTGPVVSPHLEKLYGDKITAALVAWYVKASPGALTPTRMTELVHYVISQLGTSNSDVLEALLETNFDALLKKLDGFKPSDDVWHESSVKIPLPNDTQKTPEERAPAYDLKIHHRKLVPLIKATLESTNSKGFQFTPYKLFYVPPWSNIDLDAIAKTAADTPLSQFNIPGAHRVHGEAYTSDSWIKADEEIQAKMDSELSGDEEYENVICGLQFSSDSMMASDFGNQIITPEYIQILNQHKSSRTSPSILTTQQVAFIPHMGSDIQEVYQKHFKIAATKHVLKYLKRCIHNSVPDLLLDEDLLHAYEHGIIIKCSDGITRRVFPRIFVYSADYPEK